MRVARPLLAILTMLTVATAAVVDNAVICGDECAVAGSCSGAGHQDGQPATPHQCSLCPCHTPSLKPLALEPAHRLVATAQHRLPSVRALHGLDAPAPPTPPPTRLG